MSTRTDMIAYASNRTGFDAHKIDRRVVGDKAVAEELKKLPRDGSPCRVRGHLSGMWEPAVVVGYMTTSQGLKALVVYEDRDEEDGPAFGFVFASKLMAPAKPKPARDLLDRKYR